jgi:hypothetical protein
LDDKKMFRRIIGLAILNILTVFITGLYSQYPYLINQKKIVDQQTAEIINFSEYAFGKDFRLVNGRIYSQPYLKAKGHPFFQDIHWTSGSVTVNGKTFSGLQLNYDIFKDQLIFMDETIEGYKRIILLNKNQVTSFTIEDHSFIKLEPSDSNNITESQYFEFLYDGEISLFKKWNKEFESHATQENPNGVFLDTKTTRYLMKNNDLYKVPDRIALLKVCEDRKEEMKKYIRKNRIDVRKAPDQKLIGLIKYYNSLIAE